MTINSTLYALRSTLLVLCLGFMSNAVFAQSGTTINYEDSFDPATLTYFSLFNGKHSYAYVAPNPANSISLRYSGTRWEIWFGTTSLGFYSTKNTTSNPPNLTVGNWVDANLGDGITLIKLSGTGTATTVLPIELTRFEGNNKEGYNLLTWQTASETQNKGFDIERSTDGNTFHNIGQVKGNNKPSSYQFVDNQPFATSYYRLRQIDFDGTETVSKVVSVEQKGKSKGLKIYPTVVSNGILTVDTEGSYFQVINLLGQQVLVGKTPPSGVGGLDVSALPQGTYLLKVRTEVAKFVKQ